MNHKLKGHYSKFCELADTVRALPSLPRLTPVEEFVLNKLIILWGQEANVPVVGFMRTFKDISPTTAHRVIVRLKKIGFVSMQEHEEDGRRKFVIPTGLCEQYVAQMNSALISAQTSH